MIQNLGAAAKMVELRMQNKFDRAVSPPSSPTPKLADLRAYSLPWPLASYSDPVSPGIDEVDTRFLSREPCQDLSEILATATFTILVVSVSVPRNAVGGC